MFARMLLTGAALSALAVPACAQQKHSTLSADRCAAAASAAAKAQVRARDASMRDRIEAAVADDQSREAGRAAGPIGRGKSDLLTPECPSAAQRWVPGLF